MPNINWGMLTPAQNSIQSAQPVAQAAPNPLSGGGSSGSGGNLLGGLLGGLKDMFGSNPVSTANAAVNMQMQNTDPSQLAQTVMGLAKPQMQGMPQQVSQQTAPQGNPLSIDSVRQMSSQAFPNDPIRQQLATAQAAQESGLLGGKPSGLATKGNNLFGMKGQGTDGSISMPTNEFINGQVQKQNADFAKYKSPQDSINAYKQLLQNPRYKGVLDAKDFDGAAQAVQKAGYATDPKYADQLTNINNKLNQTKAIDQATKASMNPNADYMDIANSYMGKGVKNDPEALREFFRKSMGQDVNPRTTPWCAAFANSVLMNTGHAGTGSLAARSFLNYGTATKDPSQGDVVVFKDMTGRNDPAHGHVGFYVGQGSKDGYIKVLGGNQGGQVRVREYPASKVIGYRIPPSAQELQAKAQDTGAAPANNARQPQGNFNGGMLQSGSQMRPGQTQQPFGSRYNPQTKSYESSRHPVSPWQVMGVRN